MPIASSSEAVKGAGLTLGTMASNRRHVLGWRVGWRVARRSFFNMCNSVYSAKSSVAYKGVYEATHCLSSVVKAEEKDFGILGGQTCAE